MYRSVLLLLYGNGDCSVEQLYMWLAPDRVSFEGVEHAAPTLTSSSSSRGSKAKMHRLIIMPHKALPRLFQQLTQTHSATYTHIYILHVT